MIMKNHLGADKTATFIINDDVTIKQAMLYLTGRGIKTLFVVDNNQKLTGALTDGDIRRGITNGIDLMTKITHIMKTNFLSVNCRDKNFRQEAIALMKRHMIEHVPVLDDDGCITDIISWYDEMPAVTKDPQKTLLDYPVVIMAGGKGTRLDPFTKILPKPLIPLGDKPVIEIIMDRYYERGFHKFKMVLNHKKEMIKIYFSENKQPYEIEFVEENKYCGTVGGLYLLKGKMGETFILTNCDTLLDGDYSDFIKWHKDHDNLLTIIGSHKEVAVPYGVLSMVNGSFVEMIEKPKYDLFVNTGTYIVEPDVLNYISEGESIDIDKLILRLKEKNEKRIGVFPCWGRWFDIGQWDEYKSALKNLVMEG